MNKISAHGKCPKCGMSWNNGIDPETNKHLSKLLKITKGDLLDESTWIVHYECPYCVAKFNPEEFK